MLRHRRNESASLAFWITDEPKPAGQPERAAWCENVVVTNRTCRPFLPLQSSSQLVRSPVQSPPSLSRSPLPTDATNQQGTDLSQVRSTHPSWCGAVRLGPIENDRQNFPTHRPKECAVPTEGRLLLDRSLQVSVSRNEFRIETSDWNRAWITEGTPPTTLAHEDQERSHLE